MDCVLQVQERGQWRYLAKKSTKRRIPQNAGDCLTNRATKIFPSGNVILEVSLSFQNTVFVATFEPFFKPYLQRPQYHIGLTSSQ
jgi:hypothetical protein